jgi:hypothetical protein
MFPKHEPGLRWPAKSFRLEQVSSIAATKVYDSLEENQGSPTIPSASLIATVLVLLFDQFIVCMSLAAQVRQPLSAVQTVNQMVQAETAAWRNRQHFLYRNEERSNRTNGHLWDELVVETSDGPMQRLIFEDGKTLSNSQKKAEDKRITYLANHPGEFRRKTQRRKDDEARMPDLLREIPNIFLFKTISSEGDYTRIAFQPNPSFQEESYQDRVVHAMSGVLLIHRTDMRLCELDAHLGHRVQFGFGILGELSDKTHFSLAREEVSPGQWTTNKIRVHLDGSILLLKSISRDVDSSHSGFKLVPHDLTVAKAAAIVRSNTF